MATLAQIRNAVDARLADFFPKIRARQEQYAGNHGGNYWQGIAFSTVPDDGALVSPDYSVRPTDQPSSWADAGVDADLPAGVEAQLRIDVYGAPGGHYGYFVTARISKNGITYGRTARVEDGVVLTAGSWAAES